MCVCRFFCISVCVCKSGTLREWKMTHTVILWRYRGSLCTVIERVKQLHLSVVGGGYQRTRQLSKGQNERPLAFSQPSLYYFSFFLTSAVSSVDSNQQ